MIEDQVKKLIQLRLQQARESLLETDALYQVDLWRGTINRAYYAMFYAVLALAVYRQEITSKHSGLITFFDREFVKEGAFPKELSKSLHLGSKDDKRVIMGMYLRQVRKKLNRLVKMPPHLLMQSNGI
jgi:uncharacterized protein (UPF0332 family)